MKSGPPDWVTASRLWLVLDYHAAQPRTLAEATAESIAGGVDVVVCRLKNVPESDVLRLAKSVREVCHRRKCPFVLSHRIELVPELAPEGLHLGQADPWRAIVTDLHSSELAVGYSAHSVDEAESAQKAGCDYTFLGPVFHNPEKIKMGKPLGLNVVRLAANLGKPVVYIGGINETNIRQLTAAGAIRVAAIRALQDVPDPLEATRALKASLVAAS